MQRVPWTGELKDSVTFSELMMDEPMILEPMMDEPTAEPVTDILGALVPLTGSE
jgi:hypothetical protein